VPSDGELLRTPRLALRRFTAADLDDVAGLLGDRRVMRYLDTGWPVPREVVAGATLPAIVREYDLLPPGLGCWAVCELGSGAFAGWVALRPAREPGPAGGAELGYRMRPDVWGRGFATEAASALVGHAFARTTDLVAATTMTVNVASRRVLEHIGLRYVRTFFEYWPDPIEGSQHGDVEYALTRAEWACLPI
jgi:RimJ/RimL family protein N-acetyltransferase